jgi:hypothetical protein
MSRPGRIERFRRAAAGGSFITSLRAAGAHHPRDSAAIAHWRLTEATARPTCFGCRDVFSAERRPGAFLTARASRSPHAGTAAAGICAECWSCMTPGEIETAALAVLRRNLSRHGKWVDGVQP